MIYIILFLALLAYLSYGIIRNVKNKSLPLMTKIIWLAIMILLPVLGVSGYLRTNFKEKHGRW